MYWADELAASVAGPQVVNDSKTPSGTVHVGSLRGPVILDVIARALRERGLPTTLLYGVDDMDPMDAQALLTADSVEREMGRPLAHVPDPADDCHASYARHFAGIFIETFAGLGIHPDRYYWMSDIYPTGELDPFIRTALDRAEVVRDVYRRVSKVERPAGWLPVHVVCPACGKVGTTIATDWDGVTVAYECRPDYVTWARGCGAAGRISPFGGAAKLPWNLEWAAQWSLFGVTIEPCGKDLATAGGSRDRSDALAREVFDREPPRNLPYEFVNIGGRKMSTSRGRGESARRMAEILPPEPLRLLFLRPRPNQAIEFDPAGTDAIPRLFDELDRLAAAVAGRPFRGELPPDPQRLFGFVLPVGSDPVIAAAAYRPSFAHLALLAQIPGVDVAARIAEEKGSPLTAAEEVLLAERLAAARAWLDSYAPEDALVRVRHESLPTDMAGIDEGQRAFLAALADAVESEQPRGGEAWQALLFRVAGEVGIAARRAFEAVYLAFLGRPNGPRAGWLLAGLAGPFTVGRLREAAGGFGSDPGSATEMAATGTPDRAGGQAGA
jgi:lysyl-tRNA synthetase class 1